jgi:ketosteroid isomerase-like protein
MRKHLSGFARVRCWACLAAAAFIFAVSSGTGDAQKKQAKESQQSAKALPVLPVPVAEQIDHNIGEMLAGFQIGDAEMMHKFYADNATFVRGSYDPPVAGWQNYAAVYNQQRAAFQGMQLIRRNTFIFTHGDAAWACYQWEFVSQLNGRPYEARGQTTLVFNKVGENWLIVHNHTSEIYPQGARRHPATAQPPSPAQTPAPEPSKP